MFRLLVCLVLLTATGLADDRSVVALEVQMSGHTAARGSAVLIPATPEGPIRTGRYLLITASHCVTAAQLEMPDRPVVREALPKGSVVTVFLKDAWYPCSINSYSAVGDLALLEVECDEVLTLSPVASCRPEIDHKVFANGYVLGLDQHRLNSVVKSKAFFPTCDALSCPTNCIVHGMSGGAVFNDKGEVCGIISSIDPKAPWVSYYTHADEINRFIKTYEPSPTLVGPKPAKPIVGDQAVPRRIGD